MIFNHERKRFILSFVPILSLCVFISACEKADENLLDTESSIIHLNIVNIEYPSSFCKSLVESTSDLQNQSNIYCKNIGIYGKEVNSAGLIFDNTQLYYQQNRWSYEYPRKWQKNENYHFFAYYPYVDDPVIKPSYNEENNILSYLYDTQVSQDDLLIAYTHVDTSIESLLKRPVQLRLSHALAAVRFLFKLNDHSLQTEKLKSCYLKTTDNNLFTTEALLSYNQANKYWESRTYAEKEKPLFQWEVTEGLPFSSKEIATAYTFEGKYSANDGWLLLIPQEITQGSLWYCFTTSTKSYSTKLNIPEGLKAGKRYTFTISLSQANEDPTYNTSVDVLIEDWNIIKDDNHHFDFYEVEY